ncbi:MAG: hypothetical protein QXU32_02360 [Nitrososphaerales archaeon]
MPQITELSVNVSLGVKANIGNYESADAHISRSERWDVTGLSLEEVNTFYWERFDEIKQQLTERIESQYQELIGG